MSFAETILAETKAAVASGMTVNEITAPLANAVALVLVAGCKAQGGDNDCLENMVEVVRHELDRLVVHYVEVLPD